jgi:hypothetical protein
MRRNLALVLTEFFSAKIITFKSKTNSRHAVKREASPSKLLREKFI